MSRVPNQNDVSHARYMVEIHHSGWKPRMCSCAWLKLALKGWFLCVGKKLMAGKQDGLQSDPADLRPSMLGLEVVEVSSLWRASHLWVFCSWSTGGVTWR